MFPVMETSSHIWENYFYKKEHTSLLEDGFSPFQNSFLLMEIQMIQLLQPLFLLVGKSVSASRGKSIFYMHQYNISSDGKISVTTE